jgi:eukaryotic-like serine/threonine-protein kinase
VIGRGAMGVIYAAHDPVIDRKVAIKLIRADLLSGEEQADYVARFQREARTAGRCTHPNIVAIYDFAVHEKNPFLAMEYVEAGNLGQVLAQSGRFPPPQAVAIACQVLDALGCAHGLGIVHRDVKPANILLLANGTVKMTDFGIARFDSGEMTQVGLTQAGMTQAGSVIGTPSYMSPEQCRGEAVDARSDLFSTGVVLYEMLSLERPFAGRNFAEIAHRLLTAAPPDIREKNAAVSPALAAIIERALAKQPADRYASAAEMAAALRQLAPGASPDRDDRTVVVPRALTPSADFAEATLTTIERKLAQHVGPIAHRLVQDAARQAASLDALCATLEQKIERADQRTQFRNEVLASRPDASVRRDAPDASARRDAKVGPDEARRAEQELVRHVGPIARILVKRASDAAGSADEFWQLLAAHINADADRQAFLRSRK